MAAPLRLTLMGATGRMGRALIEGILDAPDLELAGALTRSDDPLLGVDAGSFVGRAVLGVEFGVDIAAAVAACDVVVDFSRPAATLAVVEACRARNRAIVVGTTGFDSAQAERLAAAARSIALCQAANFSIGVNVCLGLLALATPALGPTYDVEIVEAHHRHKVDAPSGTALAMGRAVAAAAGTTLEAAAVYGRQGNTGERPAGKIGFAAVRGGDVVGDHTVMFLGDGERVEISHRASSRTTFAGGALRAARWLARQPAGRYDMRDVLGLK
ncbi:MAG: 4-hydroxy-tetrahydrodipicolinate reductase [Nevskiaceae bacterium]|nr:MAG: 4-hydroxy-tetrahydrodipicolinate reductase [Nevskiaceae bacterium]TBR71526.1 MAG: 4-hydroxy-tetrahydrodipicolinate reductase [Nevskiaceae bacterium]